MRKNTLDLIIPEMTEKDFRDSFDSATDIRLYAVSTSKPSILPSLTIGSK